MSAIFKIQLQNQISLQNMLDTGCLNQEGTSRRDLSL